MGGQTMAQGSVWEVKQSVASKRKQGPWILYLLLNRSLLWKSPAWLLGKGGVRCAPWSCVHSALTSFG